MTKQEQDKLWAELSEESKKRIRERYSQRWMTKTGRLEYEQLFGKHNLKPILTYEDVKKGLFGHEAKYVTPEDCCTREMTAKVKAIIMLLNTAKFLNKEENGSDWVPDFSNEDEDKWFLYISYQNDEDSQIMINWTKYVNCAKNLVYFRTKELAQQAIEILGEDIIRTALTMEY